MARALTARTFAESQGRKLFTLAAIHEEARGGREYRRRDASDHARGDFEKVPHMFGGNCSPTRRRYGQD